MSTPIEELKEESAVKGKDAGTRSLLVGLLALWLITFAALLGVSWNAYFNAKDNAQTLAQQIAVACENGNFGPEFSAGDEKALCENAEDVIKNNDIPAGVPGPEGPQGLQGLMGPQGPQGPRGFQGLFGNRGPRGSVGTPGTDGASGNPGAPGMSGSAGPQGEQGAQGPPGEAGPKGDVGAEGPRGPIGVVAVETVGCAGPVIMSVALSYNAETQTITLTCT